MSGGGERGAKALHASSLGLGLTQGGGQPLLEAAGIEPVNKAIENPKQDALLPAIALILLGCVIPPRPTLFPGVPPLPPLEGHIGGTCGSPPSHLWPPEPGGVRPAGPF